MDHLGTGRVKRTLQLLLLEDLLLLLTLSLTLSPKRSNPRLALLSRSLGLQVVLCCRVERLPLLDVPRRLALEAWGGSVLSWRCGGGVVVVVMVVVVDDDVDDVGDG